MHRRVSRYHYPLQLLLRSMINDKSWRGNFLCMQNVQFLVFQNANVIVAHFFNAQLCGAYFVYDKGCAFRVTKVADRS